MSKGTNIAFADKKTQCAQVAKSFMNALRQSVYPDEQLEAVFGIKMEKINPYDVKDMAIGTIVYNVWIGLLINQIVTQEWLQARLFNGDLPEQFEKSVRQLIQKAAQYNSYAGEYMPELIRRGFDKIVWNKKVHDYLKSK